MSRKLRRVLALAALLSPAGVSEPMSGQSPPKVNVPYRCANGITYTVEECKPYRDDQWCQTKEEQNGNLVTTFVSAWSSMTGRLQGCTTVPVGVAQAAPAQPSSAPQPGVYHCTNGFILTISKCDKWNGVDACFFKVENKGQVLMDSPGSVSGVAKMLRACNGDMSVVPSTRSTPGASPSGAPRTMDPAYLRDMPSVDRVKGEIKGSDVTDTMAREVAVFTYLGQFIERIKTNRSMRSPYTPDEQTVLNAYSLASYQITDEYKKSHTPAEANAFQSLHWKYEMGDADQWARQLMGKQSTAAYSGAMKDLATTQKAHYDAEMRTYQGATARQKEAANNPGGGPEDHYAKDAGSVAARHCLESGRSEMECLGEAFKVGAKDLLGGDPLEGIVPRTPVGLRLTGWYAGGNFVLQFSQDNVAVRCGNLVPQTLPYSVERSGSQFRVTVPISPKPLTLSYKLDVGLTGPGPIDVDGRVVIGGAVDHPTNNYEMQMQTATTQRQISAGEAASYGVGEVHQNGMEYSVDEQHTSANWVSTGMQHHYEPPTAPKTERCNVGALLPSSSNATISGALTEVLGSKASRSSNTTPGLRLNGTYAAPGKLKIEFRDDSATLECGESFSSEAYSLHLEGSQLMINFQNSTGPLTLALQPNGTLTGSGDVDVAGRKAIQAAGGGVDYLPRSARCSLGTLEAAK